jgi:hypothetical protein
MDRADLLPVDYSCPWCGETNETLVDPTGGNSQDYVEDCAVCCRPSTISVRIDGGGGPVLVVEREY